MIPSMKTVFMFEARMRGEDLRFDPNDFSQKLNFNFIPWKDDGSGFNAETKDTRKVVPLSVTFLTDPIDRKKIRCDFQFKSDDLYVPHLGQEKPDDLVTRTIDRESFKSNRYMWQWNPYDALHGRLYMHIALSDDGVAAYNVWEDKMKEKGVFKD